MVSSDGKKIMQINVTWHVKFIAKKRYGTKFNKTVNAQITTNERNYNKIVNFL